MAKYPVESDDNVGVIDALNYLLSGPAGLGQDFSGTSAHTTGYLTCNLTDPLINSTYTLTHSNVIALSTTERLDVDLIKCTFATPFSSGSLPDIYIGNGLFATSLGSFTSYINNYGQIIGIVELTYTYCVIRLTTGMPSIAPVSGGSIQFDIFKHGVRYYNTGIEAIATVTGPTDRVFISGQLNLIATWLTTSTNNWNVGVNISIARYKSVQKGTPYGIGETPTEFQWEEYVLFKNNTLTATYTGSPFQSFNVDTVFSSIIETPPPGTYKYEIMVEFTRGLTVFNLQQCSVGLRSLSAQVVKQ